MDNIIPPGDTPALLFVCVPIPPGLRLPMNILVVQSPDLYMVARDMVRDDFTDRMLKHNEMAAQNLLDAITGVDEDGIELFDIEEWMKNGKAADH